MPMLARRLRLGIFSPATFSPKTTVPYPSQSPAINMPVFLPQQQDMRGHGLGIHGKIGFDAVGTGSVG